MTTPPAQPTPLAARQQRCTCHEQLTQCRGASGLRDGWACADELDALQGPAGGARGEADARARDAGTPQSTGALAAPPSPLPKFADCDKLWRERFGNLLTAAEQTARAWNMPTCHARLEACRDRLLDVLVADTDRNTHATLQDRCDKSRITINALMAEIETLTTQLAERSRQLDAAIAALNRTRAYITTAMRPTSIAAACGEGLYERAHRDGLKHGLNAIDHEFAEFTASVEGAV